jgi:hypothetical protein
MFAGAGGVVVSVGVGAGVVVAWPFSHGEPDAEGTERASMKAVAPAALNPEATRPRRSVRRLTLPSR